MPGVMALHIEENRLKTFDGIDWPHDFISTETLAKTGFYYFGPPDQVRCYFCDVVVKNWSRGDSEVGEHLFWSPRCRLLRQCTTNNVPIQPEDDLWKLMEPLPEWSQDEPDNASTDSNDDDDDYNNYDEDDDTDSADENGETMDATTDSSSIDESDSSDEC